MHQLSIALLIALLLTARVGGESPPWPRYVGTFGQEVRTFYTQAEGLPDNDVRRITVDPENTVIVSLPEGRFALRQGSWQSVPQVGDDEVIPLSPQQSEFLLPGTSIASGKAGRVALGTQDGLYLLEAGQRRQLFPHAGRRRWAPTRVLVDFDQEGRLWFASRQGVGVLQDDVWQLYSGEDGLPYDDLTAVACGPQGTVWFGTTRGAIRFDGNHWRYRQGKRWLPHDEVRDIAIDQLGNAWIATAGGVAQIHFRQMTLSEKAQHFEDEIDAHHRRTKFGYVIEGHSQVPGQKNELRLAASDNDGLWTSMYGAGECFAYAATGDPLARRRAHAAFEALQFLSRAPQGSEHAPPPGFIARTVLETSSPQNPNSGAYTLEGQRKKQQADGLWRVYSPRWPKSADGAYYWKSDTSSDELDGHYFFYPLYYDLVAKTEAEKSAVREIVRANIDHLIEHNFSLHDHRGRTRWGIYGPQQLNHDPDWFEERGLKSVSMLAYLNVAHHMTGDPRYRAVAADLRTRHGYHINVMWPKYQRGLGSGNQSDDEMAFMSFYNLIKYEPDPELKRLYTAAFANSWRQEEPEMNPFFNFCFAAVANGTEFTNIWGTYDLTPWPTWLDDSIETLKRFPLDRFNWRHTNRHRQDLIRLSHHTADVFQGELPGLGYRRNGKVIPVDERYFNHWNHSPWRLDSGADGRTLGTGSVFTLPYYMGRYYGFIGPDS